MALHRVYELMRLPISKIAKLDPRGPSKKSGDKLAVVSLVQAVFMMAAETMLHLE